MTTPDPTRDEVYALDLDTLKMPTEVGHESRICFGISWYASERDAWIADRLIRARGVTYNGGFYDGMPCGRDSAWDRRDEDGNVVAWSVTC
jgi:hypothetical protein